MLYYLVSYVLPYQLLAPSYNGGFLLTVGLKGSVGQSRDMQVVILFEAIEPNSWLKYRPASSRCSAYLDISANGYTRAQREKVVRGV